MRTQQLYMNVYRAGYYHRQGKPGCTNIHGADFFTTKASAEAAIEHQHGYLATVSFQMPVPEGTWVLENPEGSTPDPLSATRNSPAALRPWHTHPGDLPPVITAGHFCAPSTESIEGAEDPLGMTYEEWRAERLRTGFTPYQQPQRPVAALLRPAIEPVHPQEDYLNRAELLAYAAG